jgi:uncharacterized protein with FMN-binding domain
MKIFKILLIVFGILIALGLIGAAFGTIGLKEVKSLSINDIDLSKIADGTYEGTYHKARWNYDVQVTIKEHKITEVINTNEKMKATEKLNKQIAQAIIDKQSLEMDAVAGASVNTKGFLKAVENALSSVGK